MTSTQARQSEIWADIAGYEGLYQVSTYGNVKSLRINKVMSSHDNGYGYEYITLSKGKRKNYYVHRLVAEAFLSKSSENLVVNHKDHNRKNNTVENLEWVTQKENTALSANLMRHPKSFCKPTNVGEKYIRQRGNLYYFCYRQLGIYKCFASLEEAVKYKKEVII